MPPRMLVIFTAFEAQLSDIPLFSLLTLVLLYPSFQFTECNMNKETGYLANVFSLSRNES